MGRNTNLRLVRGQDPKKKEMCKTCKFVYSDLIIRCWGFDSYMELKRSEEEKDQSFKIELERKIYSGFKIFSKF